MSTFNKLFIGSVLSTALLVLIHSGAWAVRTAQSMDAAEARQIAPVLAMTSNGTVAPQSQASADSCLGASHPKTR